MNLSGFGINFDKSFQVDGSFNSARLKHFISVFDFQLERQNEGSAITGK